MRALVAAFIAVAACSSSASPGSPAPAKANPCATKGATYLFHFVEQANGTCGPVSDQILNVNADGTIAGSGSMAPESCAMATQDGCTVRNTDCVFSANGQTCHITTDVTFAKDGSSASGLETATCMSGSQSCMSTYSVTAQRK